MKLKLSKVLLTFSLIFICSISFGQEEAVLPSFNSKEFTWKDGADKIQTVKFTNYLENEIKKETLDMIVMKIMVQSKFVLKNKYSFIPKELTLIAVDDKLNALSKFIGKNAYGVESITTSSFEFDLEGNVVLQYSR